MDWNTSGNSSLVAVEFMVAGQYVVPDTGSLVLTLRDNNGQPMAGYDALGLPDVSLTTTLVTIPAEQNTIASDALFEARYFNLAFTYNGVPALYSSVYRLTPFLPIQTSPEAVRAYLGTTYDEVPNTDIDLVAAYFKLLAVNGDSVTTALTVTGQAAIYVNNMIALQAAINLLPSMQNRVMKSQTSHSEIYIKNNADFVKLQADLEDALITATADMIAALPGGVAITTNTDPIFLLTTSTDVITGA